ncbi:MAG: putative glycoside hydrolase [Oscillospiraceae bacterium]|nr:putative glycoside hydrolase [Oscillospiraceae bacterium]
MYRGLKVRRSKKLYKKRKSGFRKLIETFALVIVVSGLVFIGYTVGNVLFNYEPPDDGEIPVDVPVATGDEVDSDDPDDDSAGEDGDNDPEPPELAAISGNAVYAPSNVLASSAALSSYLETAKSGGFEAIVIEMKDEEGRILYQSGIEKVLTAGNISIGTLTAEQIANAATAAGLKPIARISTLRDHAASEKISDISYFGWLDNAPERGGKRWANPFLDGTAAYISDITGELYKAGFSDIIFANTMFPHMRGVDFEILPSHVTDAATRFAGLGEFVNKVADNNPEANILLEMSFSCFTENPIGRSAEILRNLERGGTLNTGGIVLTFNRDDFAAYSNARANAPAVTLPQIVKDGLSMVKPHSGDLTLIPLLDRDGLPDADREQIADAFKENGHENIIIRN